jgi:hypothetical protein
MFLKFVGHRWINRSIGFEFLCYGETVSRYFNVVLDALCVLSRDIIVMRTTKTHPKISTAREDFTHTLRLYIYNAMNSFLY